MHQNKYFQVYSQRKEIQYNNGFIYGLMLEHQKDALLLRNISFPTNNNQWKRCIAHCLGDHMP